MTDRIRLFSLAASLTIASSSAFAQANDAPKPADNCHTGAIIHRTFYLANTNTNNLVNQDGNELVTAMRNMLCPTDKIYLVSAQSAIVMEAPASELELASKLIADLDRPKKTYRLVYTVTELDSGKEIGNQHFAMVVVTGQRTTMKEGDKIPVATGTSSTDKGPAQTQFTYLDVGMNFDATLDEFANGVRLQSKVEQSSVGPSNTIAGVQEPVVRQSVLQGTAFLTLGKPLMLGSIDVPNSTRHLDISVVMEQVK
jgi:type II secretory pathway component GspD/PulD (secretin)